MQTHLLKPLPRRIITASSLGLWLLALPAAAQTFPIPDSMPMPPEVQKQPPAKTKAQKDTEAENQALKRQLEQARKEVDAAKAAKAQEAAARQKLARDLAKAQAVHLATPPAADSATAAAMAATVAAEASAAAKKLPELEGFVLLPGGVARNKKTRLEWMRCSLGQTWDGNTCQGEAKKFTFKEAQQAAKDLNAQGGFAGKTNWRIPTARELLGLVVCSKGIGLFTTTVDGRTLKNGCFDEGYAKPTITQGVFPNTPDSSVSWFWSSSPTGASDDAWHVGFSDGIVSYGGSYARYSTHARLVR